MGVLRVWDGSEWVDVAGVTSDHGLLSGLTDDDHTQYVLADGSRGFSAAVSGVGPVDSADLSTKNYVDTRDVSISGHLQTEINQASTKTLIIENPSDAEDLKFLFTTIDLNIDSIKPSVLGTPSSSVDWTLFFDDNREAVGTEVITGGTTTNLGETPSITTFNNPTVTGGSHLWLETSAIGAVPSELSITITF